MSLQEATHAGSTTRRSLACFKRHRSGRYGSMKQRFAKRLTNFTGIRGCMMNERTIITRDYLRRLRNEIDFGNLFRYMRWPHKRQDGKLIFVCPDCSESQTDVNRQTNLARCFRCKKNWNPIDITIAVYRIEFLEAVGQLECLLPPARRSIE